MFKAFPRLISNVGHVLNGIKKNYVKAFAGVGGGLATATIANKEEGILHSAGAAIRFLRSMKACVIISLDYYFYQMGLDPKSSSYPYLMSKIHQRSANRILEACLLNGGCYIKLGQGLCMLSHILPKEYVKTLRTLNNKCLERGPDELMILFQEDFGTAPQRLFKSIDLKPIAAASLAQVFKAETLDGEKVAVKVQYIDLQSRFYSDIATIDILLKLAALIHPNYDFDWILQELKVNLEQELNFIKEGQNAERCARDLKHLKYVYVPKIHWDLCSNRVLVTEFVEGLFVTDVKKLHENHFSLGDIDRKLFEIFGEQIFRTGFVHGDPHPGNVLIRKKKGEAEIVLLDHGLYQAIEDKTRIAVSHMWKAIVYNDRVKMKKYGDELGASDYEMLAEVLTQAPLRISGFKLKVKLSEEDLRNLRNNALAHFDHIMHTLREIPMSLLLVVRTLNTIRAISRLHGDPADRYEILSRAALKTAFEDKNELETIGNISFKFYFQLLLFMNKLKRLFWDVTRSFYHFISRGELMDIAIMYENIL